MHVFLRNIQIVYLALLNMR